MPFDRVGAGQGYGVVIAVAVALIVLLLRNRRPRRLRVEFLWVRPVVFLGLLAAMAFVSPPPLTSTAIGLAIVALVLGGALGWQRGRFMRIEVDPETHALTSRASPVGLVFVLALLAIRLGLRGALNENAARLHFPALAITDALVAFAAAMMTAQGVEMWLRARRLLAQAKAAKDGTAAPGVTPPIAR